MDIQRFIGGNLEANGYVITSRSGGECFIIDPGYRPGVFLRDVETRKLKPLGILLTHHHDDHTGAVNRLRREWDCPVYLHRLDAYVWPSDVDVYLEGGETLDLGGEEIQVIHTPGHTRGGVCFMAPESRVCFTGDTIFNVDLGRTDLDDGSPEDMEKTIREIIDRWPNDLRIYPGHGDDCTMKTVRKINREFLEIVEGGRE